MCLSSPFVKASLEIFPFSLSSTGDCQEARQSQASLQESPANTYRCPGLAESPAQLFCPTSFVQFLCPTSSPLPSCPCGTSHPADGPEPAQGNCSRHRRCSALSRPYTAAIHSSLREAGLINLVTCAHKSSGFLNNSPNASPTSWIITIWWSNFYKVQRCQIFFWQGFNQIEESKLTNNRLLHSTSLIHPQTFSLLFFGGVWCPVGEKTPQHLIVLLKIILTGGQNNFHRFLCFQLHFYQVYQLISSFFFFLFWKLLNLLHVLCLCETVIAKYSPSFISVLIFCSAIALQSFNLWISGWVSTVQIWNWDVYMQSPFWQSFFHVALRKSIILMQLGPWSSSWKRCGDSTKCTLTLRSYTLKMLFQQLTCGLFWLLSQDKVFYMEYYVVTVAKSFICCQNNWERKLYHALELLSPPKLLLHLHRQVSAVSLCCYLLWAGMGMLCSFIWMDRHLFSSCKTSAERFLPRNWLHPRAGPGLHSCKGKKAPPHQEQFSSSIDWGLEQSSIFFSSSLSNQYLHCLCWTMAGRQLDESNG